MLQVEFFTLKNFLWGKFLIEMSLSSSKHKDAKELKNLKTKNENKTWIIKNLLEIIFINITSNKTIYIYIYNIYIYIYIKLQNLFSSNPRNILIETVITRTYHAMNDLIRLTVLKFYITTTLFQKIRLTKIIKCISETNHSKQN